MSCPSAARGCIAVAELYLPFEFLTKGKSCASRACAPTAKPAMLPDFPFYVQDSRLDKCQWTCLATGTARCRASPSSAACQVPPLIAPLPYVSWRTHWHNCRRTTRPGRRDCRLHACWTTRRLIVEQGKAIYQQNMNHDLQARFSPSFCCKYSSKFDDTRLLRAYRAAGEFGAHLVLKRIQEEHRRDHRCQRGRGACRPTEWYFPSI